MKNYRMFLIGNKSVDMTAEAAASVIQAWNKGTVNIIYDKSAYAVHQICSVERIRGQELKDLCEREGIEVKDAPTIEDFSPDKKLLK